MAEPLDEETPNVARIYDYLLGGSSNFGPDREKAEQIIAAYPNARIGAAANRNFLRHAVEHALALGIDQFLDLASGIPTAGNVHEIAHQHDPSAKVAYVDSELIAVSLSSMLLESTPNATTTHADLRDPTRVLSAPGVVGLLDFSRPIALLAVTALHFVAEEADPSSLLARYREPLAPGSLLALTHSSWDYPEYPDMVRAHQEMDRLYSQTSTPIHPRTRAEIRAIVRAGGFTIDADGLVDVSRWASTPQERPLGVYAAITERLPD